ncbi:Os12g0179100 [Oryza sativa Japonica Group]|uniref:Os12g0179100 protein n=1 Tax=Oryza sativa subsp. japonica TaxID=39947 RepID=A0A0P0Y7K7_ORYSJ|nr:hypothetical protein EE612_058155 [Oryza sativa]BAT16134.1 Os12g0179100 [Oryza sativa Japonica Group]
MGVELTGRPPAGGSASRALALTTRSSWPRELAVLDRCICMLSMLAYAFTVPDMVLDKLSSSSAVHAPPPSSSSLP